MNNKKLCNKSLLFLVLFFSLFLLFYYSSNIDILSFPYFSVFSYCNLLEYNTSFTEYILEKSINNNKFILFSSFFIYFNQKNVSFILKKVIEFFSTIKAKVTVEKKFINIFNKIKLNQMIFYLINLINFKIFTHQYHEVISKFKVIDKYEINPIASGINYFDRGIRVLLF